MSESFNRIVGIMAALRAPGGCPWDRKQTHESLKPYLLEESYELLETIDQRDMRKLKEELGDVLLQVLFHSQIASEAGAFTVEDVMEHLAEKLVRRHPHVFQRAPDDPTMNSEQVLHRWEEIKRAERQASGDSGSVLQDVPKTLPALLRAYQMQARTARVGFDWPDNAEGSVQVWAKIDEELRELREAIVQADQQRTSPSPASTHETTGRGRVEAEFGDLLFSLVNCARHLKLNPEEALRLATNRFAERFRFIEAAAARTGRTIDQLSLREMDHYWETAKTEEQAALAQDASTAADARSTPDE